MSAVFDQLGIRFAYPENWSVDQSENARGAEVVTVNSPHTAYWQVSKHAPGTELEPLFDEALAAFRAEYNEIEVEPAAETVERQHVEGFSAHFFCLDLTNTCWLRGITTPNATYLIVCQAEDREFDQLVPVFQAMLTSMIRDLR